MSIVVPSKDPLSFVFGCLGSTCGQIVSCVVSEMKSGTEGVPFLCLPPASVLFFAWSKTVVLSVCVFAGNAKLFVPLLVECFGQVHQ